MKHPKEKQRRARTERRRRERNARKAAPKGTVVSLIAPTDGSAPHLYDDCPICRAMAEIGLHPDADGTIELDAAQYEELGRRKAEHVRRDGIPDGAVFMSGDEIERRFQSVRSALVERGYPADLDLEALTDEELAVLFDHVEEIGAQLDARPPSANVS